MRFLHHKFGNRLRFSFGSRESVIFVSTIMAPTNEKDNNSSSSSGSDKDDNLSAMLNELDMSDDLLGSIGGSAPTSPNGSPKKEVGLEVSVLGEPLEETMLETATDETQKDDDTQQWKERLAREEIFSHRYKPSQEERKELEDLEIELGLQKPASRRSLFSFGGASSSNINDQERTIWNQLVHPDTSKKEPSSILVKRGRCNSWRQGNLADMSVPDNGDNVTNGVDDDAQCEVILLTHGLAVAKVTTEDKQKEFSRAIQWSHVLHLQHVRPTDDQDEVPTAWQIVLQAPHSSGVDPPEVWTFVCESQTQQRDWFDAVERAFIEFHMHSVHKADLGWQYRYILKPGFTMAVTGRVDNFSLTAEGP